MERFLPEPRTEDPDVNSLWAIEIALNGGIGRRKPKDI